MQEIRSSHYDLSTNTSLLFAVVFYYYLLYYYLFIVALVTLLLLFTVISSLWSWSCPFVAMSMESVQSFGFWLIWHK